MGRKKCLPAARSRLCRDHLANTLGLIQVEAVALHVLSSDVDFAFADDKYPIG